MMFFKAFTTLFSSFVIINTILLSSSSSSTFLIVSAECKIVDTVDDFDIDVYASKPWYSHQQAVNSYSPIEQNYCTTAVYTVLDQPTFWGYGVGVNNTAQYETGQKVNGLLCAYQTEEKDSKLAVAPCFLPKIFAGPYWIVAYDEEEGYALISGGQPTEESDEVDGLCTTGTGINNSGLWIFSRSQTRNETLINHVRAIAVDAGFDISVLNDVDHTNCHDCEDTEEKFTVGFGFFSRERDCDWVANWAEWRCNFYSSYCPATCEKCPA